MAFTPFFTAVTAVSRAGMSSSYFNHSETATVMILLATLLYLQDKERAAAASIGLTALINPFIGMWGIIWFNLCELLRRGNMKLVNRFFCRRFLQNNLVILLLAVPMGVWIFQMVGQAEPHPSFSFIQYLEEFFPFHSLIWKSGGQALVSFLFMIGSFFLIQSRFKCPERLRWVFVGLLIVFAISALNPLIWDQRLLLVLNGLRVDSLLHILVGLTIASVVMRESSEQLKIGELMVLLALASSQWTATFILLAVYIGSQKRKTPLNRNILNKRVALALPLVIFGLIGVARGIDQHYHASRVNPKERDWVEMKQFVRGAQLGENILIPLQLSGIKNNRDFQLDTLTPIWVGHAQGAAVMWDPAFYKIWKTRIEEVKVLKSAEEKVRYACQQKIPWVLEENPIEISTNKNEIAYRNSHFSLIKINRECFLKEDPSA
jgi:hypothetical protein